MTRGRKEKTGNRGQGRRGGGKKEEETELKGVKGEGRRNRSQRR